MTIRQLPFVNGMARALIDGHVCVRAVDVSRVERSGEDENLLSNIRAIFKAAHPTAIVTPPRGSGLPAGHYIYETHLGELVSYHHDPVVEQQAKEKMALGRGHGAGLKKGQNKALGHVSFSVKVDGESVSVSGTVPQLAHYFQTIMQENSKLSAQNAKLREYLEKANDDISYLMNNPPKVDLPEPSNVVPFRPKAAVPKHEKPRYRSVNGKLEPVGEIWAEVPGHPKWQVSNFGRFRGPYGGLHRVYFYQNFAYVQFIRRKRNYSLNGALAVALAFCGPRGAIIRFKDGNRRNIHASNLVWVDDTSPRQPSDYRPRATLGVAA